MTPEQWQKIEEIFQAAVDLKPSERAGFIVENSLDDVELRREVEKLLADYESAESFIESPVWTDSKFLDSGVKRQIASSLEENSASEDDKMIGRRIGVFELKKEIGRGGMGAVYLAERADGEFVQKAAVKLIKRGMDSDFIVRRFRHERQILASLDHPNIARLLDGGTTEDGLPYFVMEFIEGLPVHQFCDEMKLNIRERLKIFGKVCEAIQSAHERQIIHRDIKPGNILITSQGIPKLLDFGIAKILDPDLIHESLNPTSTLMRLMTLEYASPEQIRGGEITPASDIYALGVLLYELLSGHRPYNFKGRAPHEISRVVCEVKPVLPSQAVAGTDNLLPVYVLKNISPEKAAALRRSSVENLRLELTDHLDNIILKSLSKKPSDRYKSAKEFFADITRYLDGKQILAEPSVSTGAYFEETIIDHSSGGFKSIAVLPLKLLNVSAEESTGDNFLGIGLADALITRLSNIERFVVRPTSSVLRFGERRFDPFVAGRQLGVEYIVDGHIQKAGKRIRISVQLLNVAEQSTIWAERFDENFTDVLSLEDVLSTKVAEALVPYLTIAERENLAKRGTENPQAFEAYLRGRYHWNTFTEDGFAKAIVAYTEAVAHDENYALAYAGIADYYNWLGVFGVLPAQECFQAALASAEKAIEIDDELSEAHAALGFAAVAGNLDWARGERACRRALELNPKNSTAQVWYSIQLFMEGRFDEGLRHARRGIKFDPLSSFNQHNLGWGLYFARRFDESIRQYQKVVAENPNYPLGFYGLSWSLRYQKRFPEAIEAAKRAVELSDNSPFMLISYSQTLAAAGNRNEAEKILSELEKLSESRFISPYHLAIIYSFLGDKDKALENLEKSLAERESWAAWMGVEPAFDFLQSDPRFRNLLEQTKNPLFYQAETIIASNLTDAPTLKNLLITNPDSKAEKLPHSAKTSIKKSRFFYTAIIGAVVLVAALIGFTVLKFKNSEQNYGTNDKSVILPESPKSKAVAVAILPFATTGAKNDNDQFLGVGTADLVTSKLSQINALNVRSASSVRRYLKSDKPAVVIGREIAVDFIVSGDIERKNGRVEAKLEMTETSSGRSVWTEIFDEPENNLFALQDSISERIAQSLSLKLTSVEKQNLTKHFTESSQAQQIYLAGRFHFGKRTVEGLQTAISLFEQAVSIDPGFALSYTGLADCYSLLNWYQEPPPPDAWERAKQAAEKAVSLDSTLAEAHASLAFTKFHFERDFKGAEDEFRRAINLKPNYATAYQWYAFFLSAQARHDEAVSVMRRAEELEPRSAVIANAVANVLLLARRYDESIAQAEHSLDLDPSSVGAHVILRWNYEMKKMPEEALRVFENEIAFAGDTPTSRAKRAHVFAAVGKSAEARKILDQLIQTNQTQHITPYEIAVIYSLLGDASESLTWLTKARNEHAVGFSFVKVDPLLDNVRADKRFESLLPF